LGICRAQKQGQKATPEEIRDAPPMSHKLVRVHPDTGRKCLFHGRARLAYRRVADGEGQGAPGPARSARDRGTLHLPATAGGRVIWLMWDNRCLLHRADPNFDAALYPRVLHRTSPCAAPRRRRGRRGVISDLVKPAYSRKLKEK
jgi:taurine dioxygenase